MDTETPGTETSHESSSFRRILLIACLGSALGGMLIAGAFHSLKPARSHCACPYSNNAR